ncbi:hypothetical protein QVD17_30858 [Tagetes erecta]|uniref:Uncharacterized protein n=1 Tax=Tagetes erecta TaxID=13708 RepID=A0AAD8K2M3_TARER|nr:hypothetical protein QVD17_30858 [Tagetes erecta]
MSACCSSCSTCSLLSKSLMFSLTVPMRLSASAGSIALTFLKKKFSARQKYQGFQSCHPYLFFSSGQSRGNLELILFSIVAESPTKRPTRGTKAISLNESSTWDLFFHFSSEGF